MTRSVALAIGEFYHIYNRGTEKRKIFLSSHDYERFIARLYLCNSTGHTPANIGRKSLGEILKMDLGENLVDIGAYCLMPNHFHLLIRETVENGISRFMQRLTTSYSMYFNKKNDRSGNLFQGVFKAQHVDRDEYLKYLFAYIHLNPVKLIEPKWKETGIKNRLAAKKFLKDFPYSSYQDYIRVDRKEKVIINPKVFPEYFEMAGSFQEMVDFWLDFQQDDVV